MKIQEDYCSFELSKLLKEKGFDGMCDQYFFVDYKDEISVHTGHGNWNAEKGCISIPTTGLAMMWLREKDIFIDVSFQKEDGVVTWFYIVFSDILSSRYGRKNAYSKNDFPTYEEAVEAALKYTLENLI